MALPERILIPYLWVRCRGTLRSVPPADRKAKDMTKFLRIPAAVLLIGSLFTAEAQTGIVVVTDKNGNVVNGTTVYHPSLPTNTTDTVKLNTALSGGSSMEVNMRRYELSVPENTRNFFCWGVCYLPRWAGASPAWLSQHPLTLEPGLEYEDFNAYYQPLEQEGSATFRYVWFPTSEPLSPDSVWVDIVFGGTASVPSLAAPVASMQVYPNPSHGEDVTLKYDFGGLNGSGTLVVYDLLGQQVHVRNLPQLQGQATVRRGELQPGVYFANLEANGRVLGTWRMVISD